MSGISLLIQHSARKQKLIFLQIFQFPFKVAKQKSNRTMSWNQLQLVIHYISTEYVQNGACNVQNISLYLEMQPKKNDFNTEFVDVVHSFWQQAYSQ